METSTLSTLDGLPGFDRARGYLVDPSERLTDERCPECGWRLLEFDANVCGAALTFTDCPWCMTHREEHEGPTDEERARACLIAGGFPPQLASEKPDFSVRDRVMGGGGVWVTGPCASARAAQIATAAALDGIRSVRYVTEFDLFHAQTDGIEQLYTAGLVVIDGIGSSTPGQFGAAKLGAVIDQRVKGGRPTIAASLLMASEALDGMGAWDAAATRYIHEAVSRFKGVLA